MKQRGFTLIEIMVVIGLVALLVLVVAPFGGNWMRDAELQDAESQLTQAIGRAKAAALRNKRGETSGGPVAAVCLSNTNIITLREGNSAAQVSCGASPTGDQLWQSQLKTHITVQVNSSAFACVCFNNKGIVTNNGGCSACAASTQFSLTTGSLSSTLALY
jgi:type IV pilus assembly protein PilA